VKDLSRRLKILLCIAGFPVVLLSACAKIASPPGGPVDKTPPQIIATVPSADAVKVAADNKITVVFSEDIDHNTIAGAIHISPRPEKEVEYKWAGETLNIILPGAFDDSTTYIISLGAGIKDMRGNALANSHNFAFSTGEKIDQGGISGAVFRDGQSLSGVSLGLFRMHDIPDFRYDSLFPVYLTQSGNDGRYEFKYLPAGNYFALAFMDQNKNQKFDYPRESFGMPDRMASVADSGPGPRLNFSLIMEDTSRNTAIISASLTLDYLVKIRLARDIPADTIAGHVDKIRLETADSIPQLVSFAKAIKETGEKGISSIHAYFPIPPEGRYQVKLDSGFPGVNKTPEPVSPPFEFKFSGDKTPPRLEKFSHENKGIFPTDSLITLHFSEPMSEADSLTESISFLIDSTMVKPALTEWVNPFILEVILSGLDWGDGVSMFLDMPRIFDINGNPLGDTVKSFQFRVFDRDSLGEISGHIVRRAPESSVGNVIMSIRDVAGNLTLQRTIAADSFRVILPPGQYILSGFMDKNGNGRLDPGSWEPRQYSETFSLFPDTVRVRYRFETAGLEFILE